MARRLSLRQIEGFLAVMEAGTVVGAAGILHISQPAVSKLLAYLEADIGMQLFDRQRGRLVPTRQGLQLHDEVLRVFGGLNQVERAIAAIRREDRRQLRIGVIPALAGPFIQKLGSAFLAAHRDIYISIHTASSSVICEKIAEREIDVGLISTRSLTENIVFERVLPQALVCVMPKGHRLAACDIVRPADLTDESICAFSLKSQTQTLVSAAMMAAGVEEKILLHASTSNTVCEFVAAGHGVSLMHPLMISSVIERVDVRPFAPQIEIDFHLCYYEASRRNIFIDDLVTHIDDAAQAVIARHRTRDLVTDTSVVTTT